MYIKNDFNFEDLKENCWNGALYTLKVIENNEKEERLMDFLEVEFPKAPTMTELNDFLWFEDDFIFEVLEIGQEEEGKDNE